MKITLEDKLYAPFLQWLAELQKEHCSETLTQ